LPEHGKLQVPETHHSGFDVSLIDLAPRASGELAAVRSLEIAELHNGNRRVWIAVPDPGLTDNALHDGGASARPPATLVEGEVAAADSSLFRSAYRAAYQPQASNPKCKQRKAKSQGTATGS
jgi:hypothetical protein